MLSAHTSDVLSGTFSPPLLSLHVQWDKSVSSCAMCVLGGLCGTCSPGEVLGNHTKWLLCKESADWGGA